MLLQKDNKNINYIVHCSDIHIHKHNNRQEEYFIIFNKLANAIKKYKNTIMIITGDIIDFKNNVTSDGVQQLTYFLQLIATYMPIIIIAGNHDVNIFNPLQNDIINIIVKCINTRYSIYYLRDSGVYVYNNLSIHVASVFDNIITYPKDNNKTNICLYHGFVYGKHVGLNYMLMHKYKKISDFVPFDFSLFGDIHKYIKFNDTCAYAGSLIQQNHSEDIDNHGFILWDIMKKTHSFIEISNDYAYVTINHPVPINKSIVNRNLRLKIRHKDATSDDICALINNIKNSSNKIIEYSIEKLYSHTLKNNIHFDDFIDLFIESYPYLKKSDIDYVTHIHKMFSVDISKKDTCERKIIFEKLEFDNMFCYGMNNTINFNKGLININGANHVGKTSILYIIIYALFDRLPHGNIKTSDVINKNADKFNLILNFLVNNKRYIITKSGYGNKRDITFHQDAINKTKNTLNNTLTEIHKTINISYYDFVAMYALLQNFNISILHCDNGHRKDMLYKLFNLDIYELLCNRAKNELFNLNQNTHDELDLVATNDSISSTQKTKRLYEDAMADIKIQLLCIKQDFFNTKNVILLDDYATLAIKIYDYENKIKECSDAINTNYNKIINYKLINTNDKKKELLNKYIEFTGHNGIPFMKAQELCKHIEDSVNAILSQFNTSSIQFDLNKSGQRGVIDIYKTNPVKILSETSSSFESVALDLAFKLSMRTFYNTKCNIFMIDEAFSHADKKNIIKISDMLTCMKKDYDSIFMISHDDNIKSICDKEIVLVNENNMTRIA